MMTRSSQFLRPMRVGLGLVGLACLLCGCRALDLEIRLKEINLDPTSAPVVAPLVEDIHTNAPGVRSTSLL